MKIGVTGTFCSGKDSFAEYLKNKGFEHFSLSNIIREEADKQGIFKSRESLWKLGNVLREKEGSGVLAKRAIAKMSENKDYIITSIRNPLEVKELASTKDFVLIKMDAPVEIRFKRILDRGGDRKEDDPKTFQEFLEKENREMKSDIDSGQNIKNCMDMAKFSIINDGTLEELYKKIDELIPILRESISHKRPNWDEYFMELAMVVGKRGTCSRGRSGCVIVKNKRVMTTGYVGAPPGLVHCDEIGHWFKKTIHEDGSVTQHCIRTVHAEANAVAQAAKHGINIEGATLYCNMEPCLDCTKLLISSGIKRIVCNKRYHAAKETREMLEEAEIKLEVLHDEVQFYEGQK